MPRWYITAASFTMKKYLLVLSALVLFAFSSCQKVAGDLITKDFNVGNSYTALEVQDAFEVTVSDVGCISVTAGEKIMPKVVVEIVDNTLKIYVKGINHYSYGTDMKVVLPINENLTNVNLSGASEFHSDYYLHGSKVKVELSGASEFYCNIGATEMDIEMSGSSDFFGDIVADEIDMDLSGASKIKSNLAATELDLDMTGASDATLEGRVGKLDIDLAGASKIVKQVVGNHYALVCDQCEGTMSGSSDAYIHCDGKIKVILSGGSELHFTGDGNPANSSISSGSGIIHDVLP